MFSLYNEGKYINRVSIKKIPRSVCRSRYKKCWGKEHVLEKRW